MKLVPELTSLSSYYLSNVNKTFCQVKYLYILKCLKEDVFVVFSQHLNSYLYVASTLTDPPN